MIVMTIWKARPPLEEQVGAIPPGELKILGGGVFPNGFLKAGGIRCEMLNTAACYLLSGGLIYNERR